MAVRVRHTKDLRELKQYAIGDYTYGTPRVMCIRGVEASLTIGKFCSIADEVRFILGAEHRVDWATTYPFPALFDELNGIEGHPGTKGDIIVGNDVWLGHGATIMSGVTIGDGAVVGAMSVVAKDVQPYAIVAGNPAKVIRKRFSKETIDWLVKAKWWDWELPDIISAAHILCSPVVDGILLEARIVAAKRRRDGSESN